jgi:hypothetical protein
VIDELETMWNKDVVASFNVLTHFPGEAEINHETPLDLLIIKQC